MGFLAAALVRLGRKEEAEIEARKAVAFDFNFSVRKFSVAAGIEKAVIEPFADAWRSAGVPEE